MGSSRPRRGKNPLPLQGPRQRRGLGAGWEQSRCGRPAHSPPSCPHGHRPTCVLTWPLLPAVAHAHRLQSGMSTCAPPGKTAPTPGPGQWQEPGPACALGRTAPAVSHYQAPFAVTSWPGDRRKRETVAETPRGLSSTASGPVGCGPASSRDRSTCTSAHAQAR